MCWLPITPAVPCPGQVPPAPRDGLRLSLTAPWPWGLQSCLASRSGKGRARQGCRGRPMESGVRTGAGGRNQEHTRMRTPLPDPRTALAGPLLRHAGWCSAHHLDGLVRSLLGTFPCSLMQEGPGRWPQKPVQCALPPGAGPALGRLLSHTCNAGALTRRARCAH